MTRAVQRRCAALMLVFGCALGGCAREAERYEHAEDHPEGHDHHQEDHGHDAPMQRQTRWSSAYEVFVEHSTAQAGRPVEALVYVTRLDRFRPQDEGGVRLEFEGPERIEASAEKPARPGVYEVAFTPGLAGSYRGRVVIEGAAAGSVEGLTLQVFASASEAKAAGSDEEDEGVVELLKEQQWGVPFATAFVETGTLTAAIVVAGSVQTPPGGYAEVGAPLAGRLLAPPRGFVRPGETVKKGQLLAGLVPAPAAPEEAARVQLAVAEADTRAAAAQAALERAERLIADQAIAQRELDDARRERELATHAQAAARRAAELFTGASSGAGTGSWRLLAPISGTMSRVDAAPGAAVSPSQVLFVIVDEKELWIRSRVPEQDAPRLRSDRDAFYQVAGLERWQPIDVTGDDATATLVSVGRTVDPSSRTVEVIHSLHTPDPDLRVGGMVQVSLPVGDDFSGPVVPEAALVDDDGRARVYVQVDGEHFAEQSVRMGPRAGGRVGIVEGLKAGARIVTEGAHLVRLAERASTAQPHGHIH